MRCLILSVLLVDASAFTVGVMRTPSTARRCSSAMVESWYDKKMAAEAAAANPPPGLSQAQAAENPALAKTVAAEQETLTGLLARMEAFPNKKGTMYFIVKEKIEVSENLLAGLLKTAMTGEERAELERVDAEKRAKEDAERKAAADVKKAEVEAAAAAKRAEETTEKKKAAEAKKAAASEAAATKKAQAEEAKTRKAAEAAAKKSPKAPTAAAGEDGAGASLDAKVAATKKKGFELPNPFAKKK